MPHFDKSNVNVFVNMRTSNKNFCRIGPIAVRCAGLKLAVGAMVAFLSFGPFAFSRRRKNQRPAFPRASGESKRSASGLSPLTTLYTGPVKKVNSGHVDNQKAVEVRGFVAKPFGPPSRPFPKLCITSISSKA